MDLSSLLHDITSRKGWIVGSCVYNTIIRRERNSSSISVLIPFFAHAGMVDFLQKKYCSIKTEIEYDIASSIAQTDMEIEDVRLSICSSEGYDHFSIPIFDVDSLCWDGEDLFSWYFYDGENDIYDADSIIRRAQRKEAIALVEEWEEVDERLVHHYNRFVHTGWKILNERSAMKLFDESY